MKAQSWKPPKAPSSFSVGGRTYSIEYDKGDECAEMNANGLIMFDKCSILIKPKLHPQVERHVVLHEITHAILGTMESDLNDDEEFVNLFASLLSQALSTMN